jgi:hypothetical protein
MNSEQGSKKEESKDQVPHECPILHIPLTLENAVLTCVGSCYSRQGITQWFLKGNGRDPLTGEMLPNQVLRRVRNLTKWKEEGQECRRNTELWCPDFGMVNFMETQCRALKPTLDAIRQLQSCGDSQWIQYEQTKVTEFRNYEQSGYYWQCTNQPRPEVMSRPPNTGKWFQGVRLCGITLRDKCLKSERLEGSDLSGCRFYNCDFGHVSFLMCNLASTRFIHCHFRGNYHFYRALLDVNTLFLNCTFERECDWKDLTVQHGDALTKQLKLRGLEDPTTHCL